MAPPVLVWMMMSVRSRIAAIAAANTSLACVGLAAASRTCRWYIAAPASRQRAASAPISAAVTGRPGCASLVVSAPTPATVMMSLSIASPSSRRRSYAWYGNCWCTNARLSSITSSALSRSRSVWR